MKLPCDRESSNLFPLCWFQIECAIKYNIILWYSIILYRYHYTIFNNILPILLNQWYMFGNKL